MKIPRIVGVVAILICWHAWAAQSRSADKCLSAWRTYLVNPSKANGEHLYDLLPRNREEAHGFDPACRESLYARVWSLQTQVDRQERIAVKVSFRLFSVSDGDFGESLDQILGSLIRRNPTMFLEELAIHRTHVSNLGGLLCNLGETFVDRPAKQREEWGLRVTSLKSVQKKTLRSLRDECIAVLLVQLQGTP